MRDTANSDNTEQADGGVEFEAEAVCLPETHVRHIRGACAHVPLKRQAGGLGLVAVGCCPHAQRCGRCGSDNAAALKPLTISHTANAISCNAIG